MSDEALGIFGKEADQLENLRLDRGSTPVHEKLVRVDPYLAISETVAHGRCLAHRHIIPQAPPSRSGQIHEKTRYRQGFRQAAGRVLRHCPRTGPEQGGRDETDSRRANPTPAQWCDRLRLLPETLAPTEKRRGVALHGAHAQRHHQAGCRSRPHKFASSAGVGQPSAGRPSRSCSCRTASRVLTPRMPSMPPTS